MLVIEQKITDFLTDLENGLQSISAAGIKLVALKAENPNCFADIIHAGPAWLTVGVLQTIEAVGLGQIAPELLVVPLHVFNRLSMLPPEVQLDAIANGVEVMTRGRNGKGAWQKVKRPVCKLNKMEAVRAIGPEGIRPPEEQIRLTRSERERNIPKPVGLYRVRIGFGGEAVFEKCNAESATTQNVLLVDGQATIKVCRWK